VCVCVGGGISIQARMYTELRKSTLLSLGSFYFQHGLSLLLLFPYATVTTNPSTASQTEGVREEGAEENMWTKER
jgi:hypothetical protein